MHCSSCGAAVNKNLSFCNRCGAKAGGGGLSEASFNTLVGSIVGLAIAGLGVIIGLMSVMKEVLNLSNEIIVPFIIAAFAFIAAGEAVFIWLLLSHSRRSKMPQINSQIDPQFDTNRLNQVEIKGLDAAKSEPIPSVTEHTTRTLEPVLRESKKQ